MFSLYQNDLPDTIKITTDIAIDCEAMGLNHNRDNLCLIQISDGTNIYLVQFSDRKYNCPNLKTLLAKSDIAKIFHFARFDVAALQRYLSVEMNNIYCTKIASKLCRTYTDGHGLKELCRELLGINISKQQQSSDWGKEILSQEQLEYAASDVMYLHTIRDKLTMMLKRESRWELAQKCFSFIPTISKLDWMGWSEIDIFAH